jgi:hypothetical protein
MEEDDAEHTDEEHDGAARHLIYRNWRVEKTDIHQLRLGMNS